MEFTAADVQFRTLVVNAIAPSRVTTSVPHHRDTCSSGLTNLSTLNTCDNNIIIYAHVNNVRGAIW